MRRRPRHLAGALAWTLARCRARRARRAERPQMTVPGLVGAVAGEASDAASRAASHVGTVYRAITDATSAAARTRALRARNRVPLPSLYALHPEAARLPVRSLGLQEVSVAGITGTAVAGPDQRGSDFRPLAPFRGSDWHARWLRIRTAVARMETLPPVDLQKFDGRYWVVDGHNRIAAALCEGQLTVDAAVQELVLPGAPLPSERPSMAMEMAEGTAIRTAATGQQASLELRHDREASLARPDIRTEAPAVPDAPDGPVDPADATAGAEP